MTQKFHIFDGARDMGWVIVGDRTVRFTDNEFRYMKGWLEDSLITYAAKCKWTLKASEPPQGEEYGAWTNREEPAGDPDLI